MTFKVLPDKTIIKFSSVETCELFKYESNYYIKIGNSSLFPDTRNLALTINTGLLMVFKPTDEVELLTDEKIMMWNGS